MRGGGISAGLRPGEFREEMVDMGGSVPLANTLGEERANSDHNNHFEVTPLFGGGRRDAILVWNAQPSIRISVSMSWGALDSLSFQKLSLKS